MNQEQFERAQAQFERDRENEKTDIDTEDSILDLDGFLDRKIGEESLNRHQHNESYRKYWGLNTKQYVQRT